MAILTGNWLLDSLSVLAAVITILLSWIKWSQSYWQRRGLMTPPVMFPLGNMKKTITQEESVANFTADLYKCFKDSKQPHGGVYLLHKPLYVPIDLDIIKGIMQSDFNHFVDRGMYYNEEVDPLSAHLFALEGTKWRNLRAKLTPTFTSGKMKMMFETFTICGNQLKAEMDKTAGKQDIDIRDILRRFTTDIIGNCAFGIDCNSMQNPDNEFNRYFKLFFVDTFWENINGTIPFLSAGLAKILQLKVVKPRLSNFFMRVVKDTVEYREKNNTHRKDFMHLLLQLKNKGKLSDDGNILNDDDFNHQDKVTLTLNEIAAQSFLFFLAGYETSSTTMTFCLFELAANPDIQEKARQEVERVLSKHENQLTYDAINEMHYLEQVINEALRKYPPIPGLNRLCTKNYQVPGTDIVIEKGTGVWIPVMGIQRDSDYYPEPEKFDPERFTEENKRQMHPFSFLSFGEGPRVCIGLRFGMMQTKVGISVLLKNYKFSVSSKTQLPLKWEPKSFILSAEGGIWLDYTKL